MRKLLLILIAFVLCVAATPAKKRVLLIGDSISAGYRPYVEAGLEDVAIVTRQKGNAKMTANGVEFIDEWIGDTKWDVIHFNFGLWDLCYRHPESKTQGQRDKKRGTLTTTLEDYEANLEIIVEKLEKTGAKLIFATTTCVPPKEEGRFVEDMDKYNDVAIKVMERHNITINPLGELSMKVHPKLGSGDDNVHYTDAGSKALSKQVVKYIKREL